MKNRRDFLKAGIAGAAGIAVLSCADQKSDEEAGKKSTPGTRKLGRTGLKLPVVSIGTGDTDDPGLIRAALDGGVKLLATSQYYKNGKNEKMVGDIVRERGDDSVLIVTSTAPENYDYRNGVFNDGAKVEPFIERFEGSLKRLETECVDIFLLPSMAKKESIFYEPYLRAMEDLKKQGKARFVGIATHSHEDEALRAAADSGVYDVAMVAYNFRQQHRDKVAEAMAYAAGKGMGIIGMKTMAGAYWDEARTEPINSKAALKWVLQNENMHTTVPGVTTMQQLQNDISIMSELPLTEGEKADLRLSRLENPEGPFCQRCGECVSQCALGLDIPTLMRSHMYAFGYRNLANAKETLKLASNNGEPCAGCASCTVRCSMGFDVKTKIGKIARLSGVPEEFIV